MGGGIAVVVLELDPGPVLAGVEAKAVAADLVRTLWVSTAISVVARPQGLAHLSFFGPH